VDFLIADTFTDSLARLSGEEQKAVKTAAFDLQLNRANPGASLHRLDRARDQSFWSARVTRDIRIILHRSAGSLLLCYVDHHDRAYQWAERRKLETHPTTGAAQLVEVRQRIQDVVVQNYVDAPVGQPTRPPLFVDVSDQALLSYGVPPEWLDDVRRADEDSVLDLADHLPKEAAEALLELATGGRPTAPVQVAAGVSPFEHPDAMRRFRVMTDVDALERALNFPWEKWTIFLHPAQRSVVEADYSGPARVSGSAGTGKTIVALHRAVHLARNDQDGRVLLVTFSDALAGALQTKLRRLLGTQPRLAERLDVRSFSELGTRLYTHGFGPPVLATAERIRELLRDAIDASPGLKFGLPFLLSEWNDVVDAWQVTRWEEYRDVRRLGRKTRLSEAQRATLWSVFESVLGKLAQTGMVTEAGLFSRLTSNLAARQGSPYDYVVVDEAQDISVPQLRFLAELGRDRPNALFFAGDLGQRIFQQPFSWKSLGVDVRGRAKTLHINYRTSHQIRMQADQLLGVEVSDVDGNVEVRRGTVSVFNGAAPQVSVHADEQAEIEAVGDWVRARVAEGVLAEEIGVFVRSADQLERARRACVQSGVKCQVLDDQDDRKTKAISVCSMHLAKGLEFRAVAVMACDDEVIPLQSRIESVADGSDLEDVYSTERHLLYVACTRARDHLLVTGVSPVSEFLADLVEG
jgi:superfamily I DNA/RNA helicase